MAELVLDASVVLAVVLQEANRPAAAQMLLHAEGGAIVPSLWHVEVANALLVAERKGRLSSEGRIEALRQLSQLLIAVDPETPSRAWREALVLAIEHRLSVYDACYLELSLRTALPLATFDAALRRAAHAASVQLA